MKTLRFLSFLMFITLSLAAQNISVTFTGTGASNQIDSVTATNLSTNESITLPGNETLVLSSFSGISTIYENLDFGIVYPNPFSGQTTLSITANKSQSIFLKVQNLFGQVIAQSTAFVRPGANEFAISVSSADIFIVSITSNYGTASYKIICTEANSQVNSIQYLGLVSSNSTNPLQKEFKHLQTDYTLQYSPDDIILYRCRGDIYTTIVTDSPTSSKNYNIEFVACTDFDGRNYPIVNIGAQTWMAENLAVLLTVSPSSQGSYDFPLNYILDYEGNNVSEARVTTNYNTYGALYNWEAAMNGSSENWDDPRGVQGICPDGWHLPSDIEWTILTDYLGPSAGDQMRETGTLHWDSPNEGATNASGLTVLPAGARSNVGGFTTGRARAALWSSTTYGATQAIFQYLDYGYGQILYQNPKSAGYSIRCLLGQGAPGLPILTTAEISEIKETSASSGGNIMSNAGAEIIDCGVCWNTRGTPDVNDNKAISGTGKESFTISLTGLTAGTVYYIRAYATNSVGTSYGDQKQFTTNRTDGFPIVFTSDITEFAENSALLGGDVTSDGGTMISARGFCWNEMGNPTILDSTLNIGSGKGKYTDSLSGLTANTLYYVRAYAINDKGLSYGKVKQFTTTGGAGFGILDYEGRTYWYNTIGTQIWMTENLAYLPEVSPSNEGSDTDKYYYVYDYEGSDVSAATETDSYKTYGALYNWEAAKTACPSGWHLPLNEEWTILVDFLSPSAGGKMKKTGFTQWMSPNTGATNSSGFTGLPGGYRHTDGGFFSRRGIGYFWTATMNGNLVMQLGLYWNSDEPDRYSTYSGIGESVRCLKN